MADRIHLVVDRASIGDSQLRSEPLDELAAGHVRVRVEHVAITANTVTYGQFGDVLGYWDFYPVDAEWGQVPAVGWGTVVESNVAGIGVGLHCHGWFPMASTVDVEAAPTRDGFRDDGAHRVGHARIYRGFVASGRDPMYSGADDEERHSLLRVLYLTGFLAHSFFEADEFAGVEQWVVMSASSKTAIGYAFAARQARRTEQPGPALVGVTSAGNLDFVRALALYDDVITYADVRSLARRSTVIVDVAGAGRAVADAHARLGDHIAHSMIVGKSHRDAPGAPVEAGPRPVLFFAPAEVERRLTGPDPGAYRRRMADGFAEFVADSRRWLTIERHLGPEAFQGAWARSFAGDVPPDVGVIASMNP